MLKIDIIKYLENKCSEEEKRAVINWVASSDVNQKSFNKIKAEYVASKLKEVSTHGNNSVYTKIFKKRKKISYYLAGTASVVILLISFVYFNLQQQGNHMNTEFSDQSINKIATNRGDQYSLLLPDGTTVILNSDSKISYPKQFSGPIREVTLQGEAYFDVMHNPDKPFVVKTSDLDIRVLGTTFNIKSYSEDKTIQATLVSGKVEVFKKESSSKLVLKPSQRATLNKDQNKITLDKVVAKDIISWKSGRLVFKEASLEDVLKDIERKYNVSFEVKSDRLLKYKYTGSFDDLKVEEIMEILEISSPIYFEKNINNPKINIFMKE
ncbi:ferric-dicitrate binding protein FerR, regulates iron transport through sigma-19 [Tenacibaculum sp. MAR_2009_124]|uniref:FecR family protein n=1 Tax=Tenacibaculum sp. MAR_2009_124 TaxID=1250059 RepID=UPI000897B9A2|nr:FecR domain-containing protein [Tenacibaculum sp. MAR_2009_124]SEB74796.1 ferric-dicitrate binding protein FerR, regulates iron transport through sigma-19 [Tenacibaculum sp. MAR_2009_124]